MRAMLSALLILAASHNTHAEDHSGTTVHVVFSNHLDVGFTGLDNETLNAYFHQHIPRAIWLSEWLELSGSNDTFIWTTHPWLLSMFLNCQEQGLGVICPSSAQQEAVLQAMKQGIITWHAAPFNLQWEMLPPPMEPAAAEAAQEEGSQATSVLPSSSSTPTVARMLRAAGSPQKGQHQFDGRRSLLSAALGISTQLDEAAGVAHKTVVSLRDVPGLTRAVIPHLVHAGIRAITVGVNAGSAPPDVPLNTPFIWRDPVSDSQLFAMWHAGGYGGSCRDKTAPADAPELQVGCHDDCVRAPGLPRVLCFSWRADNQGPAQDALEVQSVLRTVRQQWPGARVQTSTLEAFVDQLTEAVQQGQVDLPVVTGEIGDTWVFGVSSDPLKIARYRAAARARRQACEVEQQCGDIQQSGALAMFDRLLLKVPEHTWGLDVKTTLSYFNITYSNTHLHKCIKHTGPLVAPAAAADSNADPPGCSGSSRLVHSWQRQAAYVDWALQELPRDHPLLDHFNADITQMAKLAQLATKPQGQMEVPSTQHHPTQQQHRGKLLEYASHAWLVGIDPHTGFIRRLCRINNSSSSSSQPNSPPCCSGTNWAAGRGALFAVPEYVAYKESDYDVVWDEYAWEGPPRTNPWFKMDFGKPGLNQTWDKHIRAKPRFKAMYHSSSPQHGLTLQLHYTFPDYLHQTVGAPATLVLILQSPPNDASLGLSLVWLDKTSTRIPETLWLRFRLADGAAVDSDSWRLHKLGQSISPHEVMRNGSYSMHAVDDITGVTVTAAAAAEPALNRPTPEHTSSGAPNTSHANHQNTVKPPADVLQITPLDSPLISPGYPVVLPNVRRLPDVREGVSFNLHNNMWGTNYVMWLPYQCSSAGLQTRHPLLARSCSTEAMKHLKADDIHPHVLSALADQQTLVFRFKVQEITR